ncbi:hypothetical protein OQA88_2454 [Cercophora sp. LCS_1]
MAWRHMTPGDTQAVNRINNKVHSALPEDESVVIERLRLFPEGCFVLEDNGTIGGYAVSHPILEDQPPVLNTLLGAIPSDADQYYIHDFVLLPECRGRGLAAAGVAHVLEVGKRYKTTSLTSVYSTGSFWGRFGFVAAHGKDVSSYGNDAQYMVRDNQ